MKTRLILCVATLGLSACSLFGGRSTAPVRNNSVQSSQRGVAYQAPAQETANTPAQTNEPQPYASFTMRQREYMILNDNRLIEDAVAPMNEMCGTNIEVTIDWESWRPYLDQMIDREINSNPDTWCGITANALWTMCRNSETQKAGIQASVTTLSCHAGGVGNRSMNREGGNVHFFADWEATNNGDFAQDWFGRNL